MSPPKSSKTYPHGTRAKYVIERCRCAPCRRANAEYQKRRQRRNGYGLPAQVPARPVREHVRALMPSPYPGAHDGMGWRRIADLAGVSRSTVSALIWGRRGKPTERIKRETAEKLLALGSDNLADASLVWAENTWGYVTELVDFGVPKVRIARALGQKGQGLQLGKRYVTIKTARAVEDLHWKAFKASAAFRRRCGHPMPDHVADHLDQLARRTDRMKRAGLT